MTIRSILAAGLLLAGAMSSPAAPVAIVNSGFESLYFGGNLPPQYGGDVPPTAFPVGSPPSGWQPYGAVGGSSYVGVLNPGVMAIEPLATGFPAGAPEGDNVVLLFHDGHLGGAEFGVSQTLAATLTANTKYTLTVAVGNIASGTSAVQPYASFGFFDLRGFPGYRIELLASGAVIAVDNNTLLPDEGIFEFSTVQAVIGPSHAQLGQSLAIRLVNLNQSDVLDPVVDLEVDFDAVSLDASPAGESGLPGDYNDDGAVDAADYIVWRKNVNTFYPLLNDPIAGQIGAAQFNQWRANFGQTTGSGSATSSYNNTAVPEPATAVTFLFGILAILFYRR